MFSEFQSLNNNMMVVKGQGSNYFILTIEDVTNYAMHCNDWSNFYIQFFCIKLQYVDSTELNI